MLLGPAWQASDLGFSRACTKVVYHAFQSQKLFLRKTTCEGSLQHISSSLRLELLAVSPALPRTFADQACTESPWTPSATVDKRFELEAAWPDKTRSGKVSSLPIFMFRDAPTQASSWPGQNSVGSVSASPFGDLHSKQRQMSQSGLLPHSSDKTSLIDPAAAIACRLLNR